MKLKCKICGKCCKALSINFELDADIKDFFEEISRDEAEKINPLNAIFSDKSNKFYNCKKLVDNKCSIHDNKPDFCKNYPSNDGRSLKSLGCGFFDEDDKLDIQLWIYNQMLNDKGFQEYLRTNNC